MSEITVKKRGRPKKAEKVMLVNEIEDQMASPATAAKRSSKTSNTSVTKVLNKSMPIKNGGSTMRIVSDPKVDDIVETQARIARTLKPRSKAASKSSVLDRATAFMERKKVRSMKQSEEVSDTTEPTPTKTVAISARPGVAANGPALRATQMISPTPSLQAAVESTSESENPKRTSFITDFLSDAPDSAPIASEGSQISDRSAFNASKLSIEDIVSGSGVSDISSFPAPQPSTKQIRESAIPVTAPKSFRSHKMQVFPDAPEKKVVQKQPQRQVEPTSYSAGSFAAFKGTQPLASPMVLRDISQDSTVSKGSTLQLSSNGSPSVSKQQIASLQTSSKPISALSTTASQPVSQSTSRATPPKPATLYRPTPSSAAEPMFPPKRPTEMTPEELLRDPKFRSLRRKYTGLIVGIPVLITSSYLLYNRLELGKSDDVPLAGEVVGEKRVRGVVPKNILDDSAPRGGSV